MAAVTAGPRGSSSRRQRHHQNGRRAMLVRMCLASALVVGSMAGPAAGKESGATKWAEVGGWHIGVDHTLADSCFAAQSYQDGMALRIGFDVRSRTLYLAITNPTWRSIEADKAYPLLFVFDNQSKYESEFVGLPWGDR